MKDKLLEIIDNIFSAALKLAVIVWVSYMTIVFVGLWTHLHRYAMDALK
jgi:hypothetical protein